MAIFWLVDSNVLTQVSALADRVGEWAQHVDQTSLLLEANAPELFL